MDDQIETFDEQTEAEIEAAMMELRGVKLHDNSYTEAVEARQEIEISIRNLVKRLQEHRKEAR